MGESQGERDPRARGRLVPDRLTARRAVVIISLFTLTLTVIAAVTARLLAPEDFPNLGIAAWWALQTVTTVGYGDFVPRNSEGRVIGSIVMLGGVSFVAVVTAAIAAEFVEAAKRRAGVEAPDDPVVARLEEIATRLDRLEEAMRDSGRGPDR